MEPVSQFELSPVFGLTFPVLLTLHAIFSSHIFDPFHQTHLREEAVFPCFQHPCVLC